MLGHHNIFYEAFLCLNITLSFYLLVMLIKPLYCISITKINDCLINSRSDLPRQWPVMGSQVRGQAQDLQPFSPKSQCPDRQRLQFVPSTPGLQWHCPLLGWHQNAMPWVLIGIEPTGSHLQPGVRVWMNSGALLIFLTSEALLCWSDSCGSDA